MDKAKQSGGSCFHFDDVVVDRGNFCVQKVDEVRTLTPRAFDVLIYLIEQRGRVVEKQELFDQVWKEAFVTDNALTRAIKEIRHELGDDAGAPHYIETVPKRGYRFIAELKAAPNGRPAAGDLAEIEMPSVAIIEPEPAALTATEPAPSIAERPVSGSKRHTMAWLLTLIALLLVASAAWYFIIARRPAIDSVAVLPFLNASADPEAEFLSDGIANSIANSLAQLPQLRVLPMSNVARYKGRAEDPQEAGRALGVGAVLVGKLVQHGDRLQIQTELVSVGQDSRLWGGQYDRPLADLLSVQGEITQAVTDKLRVRLSDTEKQRLLNPGTANNEAYQLYLKGRFFWNKFTPEGLQKSIEYYQQAIALDPRYALAYTSLADSCIVQANTGVVAPREVYPKATRAVEKALEFDAALAEAHATLGAIKLFYEWDWAGAERELKRAIELNPNYADGHTLYGHYLKAMGRVSETRAVVKRAQELEPFSLLINTDVGYAFYYARQYDEAIEQSKRTLEMDPHFLFTHISLGRAYEQKGMSEQAIAAFQNGLSLSGGDPIVVGSLGHAYAIAGQRGAAQKMLDQLQEMTRHRYVAPYATALIYTGLGEKQQALTWLEKAYEARDHWLIWLKVEPLFDPLRSEPRFADLLRRLRLAE